MPGNWPARFLGEGAAATSSPYPTQHPAQASRSALLEDAVPTGVDDLDNEGMRRRVERFDETESSQFQSCSAFRTCRR